MTAAYRLKGVGWLGSCVVVVLAFYLVSLQVAAERKKLDVTNARIAAAERDIRALQTEFETRANLAQLERWNGDTLALAAPTAAQFVSDEAALAAFDVNGAGIVGGPAVQTAALVVPAALAPPMQTVAPADPVRIAPLRVTPVRATPVQTAVAAITAPTPRRPATPVVAPVRVAGLDRPLRGASVKSLRAAAIERAVAAATPGPRGQAVAMLDSKLLSDNTLGDILSRARREARVR